MQWRIALLLVLILFTLLTAIALWDYGYLGIVLPHFQAWNAGQVFADLVIALGLVMVWMYQDARHQGRNPWPWIVATCLTGSFGPLIYLLTRRGSSHDSPP